MGYGRTTGLGKQPSDKEKRGDFSPRRQDSSFPDFHLRKMNLEAKGRRLSALSLLERFQDARNVLMDCPGNGLSLFSV